MPSLLASSSVLTKTLWIGGVSATMTAGVVVPMRLSASMGKSDELPEINLPADPARAQTQMALRDVFRSLGMVVGATESGGSDWIVCWTSDNQDRARVNAHEISLVGFNRVMQTIELYSADSSEVLGLASLLDESFIRTWRSRKDVHRRVLAHGLQDVALVWSDSDFPEGKLTVALTWGIASSDVQSDPLGELVRSSFTISLPGVQGTH